MQEADGHTVDILGRQSATDFADAVFVKRYMCATISAAPFAHLEAQPPRDQGLGKVKMNIVDLGADLPADLQQVSEALAGDNRHLADLALDQSIRTDRGTVGKANDVVRIEPVFGEHRCDAFDDGDIGAIRR